MGQCMTALENLQFLHPIYHEPLGWLPLCVPRHKSTVHWLEDLLSDKGTIYIYSLSSV